MVESNSHLTDEELKRATDQGKKESRQLDLLTNELCNMLDSGRISRSNIARIIKEAYLGGIEAGVWQEEETARLLGVSWKVTDDDDDDGVVIEVKQKVGPQK